MVLMDKNSTDLDKGGTAEPKVICLRTNYSDSNIGIYGLGPWSQAQVIHGGTSEQYGQPYGWSAAFTQEGTDEVATTLRYQGSFIGQRSWFTVLYPSVGEPNISVYTVPFTLDSIVDIEVGSTPQGNSIGNVFAVETEDGKDLHIDLIDPTKDDETIVVGYLGHTIKFKGEQISLHFTNAGELTQILTKSAKSLTIDNGAVLSFDGTNLAISNVNSLEAITYGFPDGSIVQSVSRDAVAAPSNQYIAECNGIDLGSNILSTSTNIQVIVSPPTNAWEDIIQSIPGYDFFILINTMIIIMSIFIVRIKKRIREGGSKNV